MRTVTAFLAVVLLSASANAEGLCEALGDIVKSCGTVEARCATRAGSALLDGGLVAAHILVDDRLHEIVEFSGEVPVMKCSWARPPLAHTGLREESTKQLLAAAPQVFIDDSVPILEE